MKLITRDTDYAVKAICGIAGKEGRKASVGELVDELKIPRPFLRKILQTLNKKKILKSHKGTGGGYSLKKDPKQIFLIDLMRIFQGPLKLNECLFKKRICPNIKTCILRKKIQKIEKDVIDQLSPITIDVLLGGS